MKNLWPEKFEENAKPSAKMLLGEQGQLLSKLTGGIVFAEVAAMGRLEALGTSLENDFVYRFDIRGKFLEDYSFKVLSFSHDITLYPVKFQLDEKIGSELGIGKSSYGYIKSMDSPDGLEEFLGAVLNSERVKNVVGSILRLSK